MEVLVKRFTYKSRLRAFKFWFIADLHVGNVACNEKEIENTVAKIREEGETATKDDTAPLPIVFLIGDLGEFISRHDKRFRLEILARWILELPNQYIDDIIQAVEDRIVKILTPIKPWILGALTGNHEYIQLRDYERNVHMNICRQLGIRNLGECALVRLLFTRKGGGTRTFSLYLHHGWFRGQMPSTKETHLHRALASWDVDLVVCGHGHKRHVAEPLPFIGLNQAGNDLIRRRRYGIMTGAFLEGHTIGTMTYASQTGYMPSDIGPVCFFYLPDKDQRWVEY